MAWYFDYFHFRWVFVDGEYDDGDGDGDGDGEIFDSDGDGDSDGDVGGDGDGSKWLYILVPVCIVGLIILAIILYFYTKKPDASVPSIDLGASQTHSADSGNGNYYRFRRRY
jgi:hypothetical protein